MPAQTCSLITDRSYAVDAAGSKFIAEHVENTA